MFNRNPRKLQTKDGEPGSFPLLAKVQAGGRNKITVYVEAPYLYWSKLVDLNDIWKDEPCYTSLGTGVRTVMIQREKVCVEMSGNSVRCLILLKNGIGIVEPRKFGKLCKQISWIFLKTLTLKC